MIHFLRDSSTEDMPKKVKTIWKPRASKRMEAPNSGLTIDWPYPRRVRSSSLASLLINFDLVEEESSPRPIYMDEDIVGPFEPFFHSRCSKTFQAYWWWYLCLNGLIIAFYRGFGGAIMEQTGFKRRLIVVKAILRRTSNVRDTTEAAHYDLET